MRKPASLGGRGLRFVASFAWFAGGLLGYWIETTFFGGRGETGIAVGIIAGTLAGLVRREAR